MLWLDRSGVLLLFNYMMAKLVISVGTGKSGVLLWTSLLSSSSLLCTCSFSYYKRRGSPITRNIQRSRIGVGFNFLGLFRTLPRDGQFVYKSPSKEW